MQLLLPLHATTIGLTTGHCPLRAAAVVYVWHHAAVSHLPSPSLEM